MIDTTKSVLVNLLFEYALDGYDEDDDGEIANSIIVKIKAEGVKEYEQSKWVKFDVNDESTYPPDNEEVLTNFGQVAIFSWRFLEWRVPILGGFSCNAWQPLPKFKE